MNNWKRYLVAIIFISFAALQWNDPDPWLWIFVYICTAAQAIFSGHQKYSKWMDVLLMIGLTIGLIYYSPDVLDWFSEGMPSITGSMKAESPHIEWVREALGLLLCLISVWCFRKR